MSLDIFHQEARLIVVDKIWQQILNIMKGNTQINYKSKISFIDSVFERWLLACAINTQNMQELSNDEVFNASILDAAHPINRKFVEELYDNRVLRPRCDHETNLMNFIINILNEFLNTKTNKFYMIAVASGKDRIRLITSGSCYLVKYKKLSFKYMRSYIDNLISANPDIDLLTLTILKYESIKHLKLHMHLPDGFINLIQAKDQAMIAESEIPINVEGFSSPFTPTYKKDEIKYRFSLFRSDVGYGFKHNFFKSPSENINSVHNLTMYINPPNIEDVLTQTAQKCKILVDENKFDSGRGPRIKIYFVGPVWAETDYERILKSCDGFKEKTIINARDTVYKINGEVISGDLSVYLFILANYSLSLD